MKFVIKLVIYAIAVVITTYLLPGVHVDGFTSVLIVSVVLIILKAILKPVLVFLTLPITCLTLGLFIFVINTIIIVIADWIIVGFKVDGILWAFFFSLILSLLVSIFQAFDRDDK